MSNDYRLGLARFGVTTSAGVHDGKRYAVWDREERRVVTWHRTFKQAQIASRRFNTADRQQQGDK